MIGNNMDKTEYLLNELNKVNYLNNILLDSIPHPALLVNKNREVIAANRLAKEAGTLIGGFCWRDFGHCLYISNEVSKSAEPGVNDDSSITACYFCKANDALLINESMHIEKKLGEIYWDIYWIPTKEKDVYLHYAIDITKRKENEESMRKIIKLLSDAQSMSHIGNLEIDINDKTVYWSDEVFRIFGYQPQEFTPDYDSFEKHLSTYDLYLIGSQIAERTPSDSSFSTESKFFRLNGEEGWLEIKGDVEFDPQGSKPIRIFITIQDITEKKQTELTKKENEENLRLLNETREMDRLRTEFITNVSHEFRTPLNIIFSSVQLFELYFRNGIIKCDESKMKGWIKGMKQNSYRLMRLINNLMDITKIDSGFVALKFENIDIVNIISKICLSVTDYVREKNLSFSFSTDIKEKIIACDIDKIETIMLNLISNAIKFNKPDGSIEIKIQHIKNYIVISVEDTGIGILKENQEKIFQRFMQVDKSLTRNYEGSGIGLSLVKSFVEMHKGQILLNSEYGVGSKFEIKLPDVMLETEEKDRANTIGNKKDHNSLIEKINIEFSDIYK